MLSDWLQFYPILVSNTSTISEQFFHTSFGCAIIFFFIKRGVYYVQIYFKIINEIFYDGFIGNHYVGN